MSGIALVTGGAGFIGSNLVRRLLEEGYRVRILDNFSTGRAANLQDIRDEVELIEGDLRDEKALSAAIQGVRYVFHLAALPSVIRSVHDPLSTNAVNITGTLHLLMAARDADVERVVFSSSSSVYGDTPTLPKKEDMLPMPLSPYALSKLAGEHYCRMFHGLFGLVTFSLRYFNVYGPRQDPASEYAAVIPRFITAVLRGESPTVYGDGTQTRDFTFVDDVTAANLACIRAPESAAGTVFNAAGGGRVSVKELAETICRLAGRECSIRYVDPRPGDVKHSQGDGSLAERVLGWRVQTSLEEGLRRTMDWFRERTL